MKTTLTERTHAELVALRKDIRELRNECWAHNKQSAEIGDKLDKIVNDHYKRIPYMISGE